MAGTTDMQDGAVRETAALVNGPGGDPPDNPTELHARSWAAVLRRTVREFKRDNVTDWAAALTYYGLLALFPALIAMVSLIGIFGDPKTTTTKLTEIITEIGPSSGAETFEGPIKSSETADFFRWRASAILSGCLDLNSSSRSDRVSGFG